jgi:uncharacterized protein YjbJ (UPF0337 family)
MSNSEQIKGNWNELKGKLKQKFAELTEDDLLCDEGKEENVWETTTKLGKTEKKLNHYLTNLQSIY